MARSAPFKLDDRGLARRIVEGVIGSAGVRILGMAFSFLVGVQLARYLGPSGYGIYGAAMAIGAIVAVPAQVGLPQLITRELSVTTTRRDVAATKGVLVWFAVIVAAMSLAVTSLGLVGLRWWPGVDASLRPAVGWALAAVPVVALLSLVAGALRGIQDVVSAQAFEAVVRPLGLALLLVVAAAVGTVDVVVAMVLQGLAALVALVLAVLRLVRMTPGEVLAARPARFQAGVVRGSGAMLGTELLRVLDGQYAVLLLGLIATAAEVGWYRAALAVAVFTGVPVAIVNLVVMPFVAQLHAQGDSRRLQLVASGASVTMLALTLVISLAVYFLGEQLVALVFGDDFRPVWRPLTLMCVAYTVSGFFGAAAIVLNMAGQERVVMAVHAVGPVVGVSLTLGLFDRLGISAAAVGMIAAEIIKGVWMAGVARRTLGLDVTPMSVGRLRNRVSAIRTAPPR